MNDNSISVYRLLQRRAREQGRSTQQVMELYVHERLLARVAASQFSDRLTLKGGMLLAALDVRGVTRDADVLARAVNNEPETVEPIVAQIAAINLDDGVKFDTDEITSSIIREEDDYNALRVRLPAHLATARLTAQLDVNFGDPVDGIQMRIPGMLADVLPNAQPFTLHAYEIEDVLAEKIVTMIDRGDLNTRERDFGDVWLIAHRLPVRGDQLAAALVATATHRGHELQPLATRLSTLAADRQPDWERYRQRLGDTTLPPSYAEIVQFATAFADPVITDRVSGFTWSPGTESWDIPTPD